VLEILAITGPIFLLIGLGYGAVRWGDYPAAGLAPLGGFVLRFCLPAMMFRAISQRALADVVEPRFLAAYAAGSLLVLGVGLVWARARGQGRAAAAMTGMGMACSNSVFVGLPIALQLVGPDAAVALALALMVENFLMIPLILALADSEAAAHQPLWRAFGQSVLNLRRNPLVVAIVLGFVASWLQLPLPGPLLRAVDLLAGGSAAAALFYIGGALVGLKVGSLAAQVGGVAFGKLVLHPLAVWGGLLAFGPVAPKLQAAALVLAGAPMLGIYPILGQKYGQQAVNAASLLVATVASFVTLAVLVGLLRGASSVLPP
jgi:predicted permease